VGRRCREQSGCLGGAALAFDHLHLGVGVVAACGRYEAVESGDLFGGEVDGVCGGVLLDSADAFGAEDGDDVVAFGE
jgi:hypothetical protein